MKPIKITGRNIMFSQPMGNEYDLNMGLIIGEKNNYLIDTGLGSGSVKPVLEFLGDQKKPVIVVNTHHHWDHIWGNCVFSDSLIVSHSSCRDLEDKYWNLMLRENPKHTDGDTVKCLPNLVFDTRLYFTEDGVSLFYTPGHSVDCISVYDEKDRVLYAGDNIGDTELEIVPYIDTDKETFIKLIEIYKSYDFEICVSGHNKPQKKDVIARMENNLDEAWQRQNASDK